MQRLKVSDPQLAESWGIIDKTVASEFIKNAQDLYGMDLRKAMENLIQETVVKTMDFEFKSGGGFFDEEWFDNAYKGREEQKKNIFEKSKNMNAKSGESLFTKTPITLNALPNDIKKSKSAKGNSFKNNKSKSKKPRW